MSQLLQWGGQSTGVSASASVLPMNTQDWSSSGWTGSGWTGWLDLLAVQGTLKSLLQHHSSKVSIFRHSAFLTVQLSHLYMTTGKTITLTRQTFVGKVMSLIFIFIFFSLFNSSFIFFYFFWALFLLFYLFIYFFKFVVNFVIHWNETALSLHVSDF